MEEWARRLGVSGVRGLRLPEQDDAQLEGTRNEQQEQKRWTQIAPDISADLRLTLQRGRSLSSLNRVRTLCRSVTTPECHEPCRSVPVRAGCRIMRGRWAST